MEYSVQDLIKILIKKWYIIILAAVLLGCGSVPLSQISYQKACEQYERITSDTTPVILEVGDLVVTYNCEYTVQPDILSDFLSLYLDGQQKQEDETVRGPINGKVSQKMIQAIDQRIVEIASTDSLFEELQNECDENKLKLPEPPLTEEEKFELQFTLTPKIAYFFSVEAVDEGVITVTVSGLEEEKAEQLVELYQQVFERQNCNNSIATITLQQSSSAFTPDSLEPVTAQLAQVVMAEPTPPSMVRVVGMASVFGVVLACFGILVFAFIMDTRASRKAKQNDEK